MSLQDAALHDEFTLGNYEDNAKKIKSIGITIRSCMLLHDIFWGGYLVTPGPLHVIHVARPDPSCHADPTTYAISWISQQPWMADTPNFLGGSPNVWALSWECHLGPEHSCFTLIWRNLKKNSVKSAFFHVNILIFAYFLGLKL